MKFLKNSSFIIFTLFAVAACDNDETQPTPTVTTLSIAEGEVGTLVTITGTNFGSKAADVSVFFNTTETTPSSVTNTTITVAVPTGATTGIVTVKVKSLEASGPSFTVLAPITVSLPQNNVFNTTENRNINDVVAWVVATTNRGTITYSITSQSVDGALTIDSFGNLQVVNASAFNHEINPIITATVSAANGIETATANVTINVADVQEVLVENFTITIPENPTAFAEIGYVVANGSGGNEGAGPVTTLVSQSPAGAFSLNGNQIQVANATLFDFETNPTITGTYSVNYLSETRTASITISLTDVDEAQINVTIDLVAGSATQVGCTTGTGSNVLFNSLFFGEAYPDEGGVYVTLADLNCGFRRVYLSNSGTITSTNLYSPIGSLSLDVVDGSSYSLATYYNQLTGVGNILKIPTNGDPITNLLPQGEVFMPTGITTDANGNIYVAETDGRKIKKFSSSGTLLATYGTGAVGGADGTASTASFARTRDVQIDNNGNLYVADRHSVRKIDIDGNVTTVAGANNVQGDAIGSATAARFNEIYGIGVMPNGKILVVDRENAKVKLIDTNGSVSELSQFNSEGYVPSGVMVLDNNTFFFTSGSALYKATLSTGSGCIGCR